MNFEWDTTNIDHITRQNVIPEEVEYALWDSQKIGASALWKGK